MAEAIQFPELAALHEPIDEALRLQTQGSLEEARRALGDVVALLERNQPQARAALACALVLCAELERECCRVDAAAELFERARKLETDALRAAALRVTRPTLHARGRIGFALYRQLGIDACVARSAGDYAERALRLGRNSAERAALGRRIRERADRLFGDPAPAHELARALEARLTGGRT